jgi:hypothetical protein
LLQGVDDHRCQRHVAIAGRRLWLAHSVLKVGTLTDVDYACGQSALRAPSPRQIGIRFSLALIHANVGDISALVARATFATASIQQFTR